MSSMDQPADAGFRIKGWHVLAAVVGFFLVVGGVNAVFVTLALKSYPGEVSATPYEDGLAYNREIARREAQAALGWRASAQVAGGRLVVEVVDRAGSPVRGLAMSGVLSRPATDEGRREVTFTEAAPGRYEAAAGEGGLWDMAVSAPGPRTDFRAERRLSW